jgi:hypothetical protein
MTDDPVEAVARAIHGADAAMSGGIDPVAGNPIRWPWDAQKQENYRKRARAAIMALRGALAQVEGAGILRWKADLEWREVAALVAELDALRAGRDAVLQLCESDDSGLWRYWRASVRAALDSGGNAT